MGFKTLDQVSLEELSEIQFLDGCCGFGQQVFNHMRTENAMGVDLMANVAD